MVGYDCAQEEVQAGAVCDEFGGELGGEFGCGVGFGVLF